MHMMDADRQKLKQKVKELENKIKKINSEKNAQERMYIDLMNRLKCQLGERRWEINHLKLMISRGTNRKENQVAADEKEPSPKKCCVQSEECLPKSSALSGPSSNKKTETEELCEKAGLPKYPCKINFRKKADRAKLPATPCDECALWYSGGDGIKRKTMFDTCKHRELHPAPQEDYSMWDISFPDSDSD